MIVASLLACAPIPVDPGESRCDSDADTIDCAHETTRIADRDVLFQVPLGDPPETGWPVALFFQGSLFPADTIWTAGRDAPLGMAVQVEVTRACSTTASR